MSPKQIFQLKHWLLGTARIIRAEEGAECCPILFLLNATPNGQLGEVHAVDLSGKDKDQWVALQRQHARDPSILVAILINEGWSCVLTPGEAIPAGHVHERADRQEVLLISLMTKTEQFLLTAEIHGTKIDDAEFIKVEAWNFQGRFIREGA